MTDRLDEIRQRAEAATPGATTSNTFVVQTFPVGSVRGFPPRHSGEHPGEQIRRNYRQSKNRRYRIAIGRIGRDKPASRRRYRTIQRNLQRGGDR